MSGIAHSRGGSRLRRRLIVQLVVVTAAVCALSAWASSELVRRTFEEQLAAELDQRSSAAVAAVESRRDDALASVAALSRFLRDDDPEGLRRLLTGGSGAADEAARLMSRVNLQWLEILDGEGTILSSAAWPEQAGLRQAELLDLPADQARIQEVATAAATVPAFVVRRELHVGSRVIHLVGGLLLDPPAMSRLLGGLTWRRAAGDGKTHTVGTPALAPNAVWRSVGASERAEVTVGDGSRWLLARQEIPGAGDIEAWSVTGVSRGASDRRLRGVRRALAGFAALAAILAGFGGMWIARRVTAPVAELVRSVDAIAAGTEDYTFARVTQDEFEELTTSFSRLHRSLDLQRQRSRAAERVAAWRDVARRVAHEVKNPLAPIRLTVENLIRARGRGGPLFDEMFDDGAATILEEVERLKRLVSEFSEFARLPLPRPHPTDLAGLIDEVAALVAAEPGLEVDVRHPPNLPTVSLDADQISRALHNVFGNAVEAMRSQPPGQPRRLTIRTTEDDDGFVRIDVDDHGPGLSPEALERLFEPYFTTKDSGTGLGLSITYRIVTEHGGVIAAENRAEGGVRVTLRLPASGPEAVASSPAGAAGQRLASTPEADS